MPDHADTQFQARYRRMEDGTKEEYQGIFALVKKFELGLADRILESFRLLKDSYPGETVDRYIHSLQTATRAHRDGRDEEYVVAALLHDLGDLLATENHSDYAAAILKPYVRPYTHWTIRQHGLFQGYYYFHHLGQDRDARERYRGHPHFEACADFCERWDQASFDPGYPSRPLEYFVPLVERIFGRKPRDAR